MLLTLRAPDDGTDLARLLGANPSIMRTVEVPGGRAHGFFPRADTAAVLLELDPLPSATPPDVPGQAAGATGAILGMALGRLFASAPATEGDPPRRMEARLPALWCPAGETMLLRLFEPLGYAVEATRLPLDPAQQRPGSSPFFAVALTGLHRPRDVISHLRVLFPLFDDRLRGMSDGETAALWEEGRSWLETHPERELLARRFLRQGSRSGHHDGRHDAVVAALRESSARRVLDLGCGPGALMQRLLEDPKFEEVVGVEVARDELAEAAARLSPGGRGRVLHGSLAYRDARLEGYDAAALVEVIEHLDPPQLAVLEEAVWDAARPGTVVVTTPNADYNALFPDRGTRMRHPDHRFEWTRAEFRAWGDGVAARHGYDVRYGAAGPEDAQHGALTQMAVFQRHAKRPSASVPEVAIRLEEVAGERTIRTARGPVQVSAEEAAAALEAMSRFAVDPRWLLCLPPTLPPAVTSAGSDALEHPHAALAYYRARGVTAVEVQPLHRGTHVVAVVCRDGDVARRRFGVTDGATGAIYTSTGRAFFATREAEEAFLAVLRAALDHGDVWTRLATEWVALEGVMGPGTPVMREVNQRLRPPPALYSATATAQLATLDAAGQALAEAIEAGVDADGLVVRTRERAARIAAYIVACRRAFRPARTPAELRLEPVRLLASEEAVHAERAPHWHRAELAALASAGSGSALVIDLTHPDADGDATAALEAAAARGDAGLVIRPAEGGAVDAGPMAPAFRCRTDGALLLAQGPHPMLPAERERLRGRPTGEAGDRAGREWALSIEALECFVRGEPVARMHACVFGALALKLGSSG